MLSMVKARNGEAQSQTPKRSLDKVSDSKDSEKSKPVKRTRVSRACDQCRSAREKCDGSQPHCQSCKGQDRECTYHEPPRKRGIQPHYIRTLELLLAWTLQSAPGLEGNITSSLAKEDAPVHKLLAGEDPEAV